MTSKITYTGDLRTVSVHIQSGVEILSDAPKDNNGQGASFSPTDALANAVGTCMMTIMGIKARDLNVDLIGSNIEITKIMQAEPRKISKIIVVLNMSIKTDDKTKIIIERAGMNCPVLLSLHPDIEKDITFHWN